KGRIENAIKKAMGADASSYEEIVYEGYAPHGVPLMVVTATDNPTRTIANVRMHFNKGNGSIGNSGTVGFLFNRMGVFRISPEDVDHDELELEMIDFGLEEMGESVGEKGEEQLVLRCAFNDFGTLQSAIEERGLKVISAEVEYIPTTTVELPDDQAEEVMDLVDRLEGDDDVQKVYHNLS
ncbi:MAG: YebC/PmpR family DNA-binding transcriptional regulator, partial [Myxococcales bacterium]|nr:YebC/PmpR family DNA-binding transcriptional regulator [Myxococcales bacterium]